MGVKQSSDALKRIFTEKNQRIIFWFDGKKEFTDILPSLGLNNAAVLRMDEHAALELKIRLEIQNPSDKAV